MKNRIYLSSPNMGGEEETIVSETFTSNWIAPLGPNVDGFEDDLKTYVGSNDAGVFTSGTASIHLALILLGIEQDDEVLCQSFTFSATANPITYQKARPVFIDSEMDTWNMDPKLLKKAIDERIQNGKRPKAIILVHLYGMPAKTKEILKIAQEYDIPVIEDAAEALGSSIEKKQCGSFGTLNILSFNGNKIITTSGGGALLSDNSDLIAEARFLATQARDNAPHYEHSHIGYNYRMSNVLAGIGRGQMGVLEERIQQKRAIHDLYFKELGETWLEGEIQNEKFEMKKTSPTGIYFLKEPEGYFSNRWLSTVIINPLETGGITREDVRVALEKENIESRPLWKPMHIQPVFKEYANYTNGTSEMLFEYGLCLPSDTNMRREDQMRVIHNVHNILNKI